ncbi:helix-turn-helix domain-containing protein [Streptomyces tricolor]
MAGRREKELVARVPEIAEVARWLRRSRRLSGLTYEQLVRTTGFSRGRLNRAANGWHSAWPVVEAFTRACGTDVGTARVLWLKAKAGRPSCPAGAARWPGRRQRAARPSGCRSHGARRPGGGRSRARPPPAAERASRRPVRGRWRGRRPGR